jgi:acyl-CoA hydrolase
MMPIDDDLLVALLKHLPRRGLIAVSDGVGAPAEILPTIAAAAEQVGGVRVFSGWAVSGDWSALDHPDVEMATFMGGYGLRGMLSQGRGSYLPVRMGSLPALFPGPLRPDVLIASGHLDGTGWIGSTEIGWVAPASDAAAAVVLRVNDQAPHASRARRLDGDRIVCVIGRDGPIAQVADPGADDETQSIAGHVVKLVPRGAFIQYGPGAIGGECLRQLEVPVSVWSGVITDAVVDLADRGLLLGDPVAGYAVGTDRLYRWIDGRPILDRVEVTHDATALSGLPFFALNTALEIDTTGQVNVERVGSEVIAGIGGHADFALAGARSPNGLSVIAMPSRRRGRPTLVDRLATPTSTPRSDVDVVVNEYGSVDLRMLDDRQRRRALVELWQLEDDGLVTWASPLGSAGVGP